MPVQKDDGEKEDAGAIKNEDGKMQLKLFFDVEMSQVMRVQVVHT